MRLIDTNPTIINLPRLAPEIKRIGFHLGRASAIQVPTIQTQVKKGVILNPVFEQKQEESHQRRVKREQKITKMLEEIDKTSWSYKNIIKGWVEKTDCHFKLETVKRYVYEISKNPHCNCSNYFGELHNTWEDKAIKNPLFWSCKKDGRHMEPAQIFYTTSNRKIIKPAIEILDDNYGKNKERNDTIQKIRDKYMKKNRGHHYEHLGDCTYKNPDAYKQFLEEILRCGVPRTTQEVQAGGIRAKQYTSNADTDLYYSFKDLNKCQKEGIPD
jgi:hypothetical protein